MKQMLGFEKHNDIIKEPFASEIRKKLIRYRKKKFTKKEKEWFKKCEDISKKYKAKWIDI